jgi:ribosomal protein S1
MLARLVCAAVLISPLFFGPASAVAEPKDTPAPAASSSAAPEHARDGGVISGKITSVDYQRSIIAVNRTAIVVMPSTQIQGSDPGYRAITDLKPGMSVEVYTSQVAGKYIAQIITLR